MLTVACLTLHHYSYDLTDVPTLMLCSGTYVGYVVVLSGEIVGENVVTALYSAPHIVYVDRSHKTCLAYFEFSLLSLAIIVS